MKKLVTSKNIEGCKFSIWRTDTKVKFFDYDTWKTFTRMVWVDRIGEEYVWLNGEFRSLSITARTPKGLQFTIGNYEAC